MLEFVLRARPKDKKRSYLGEGLPKMVFVDSLHKPRIKLELSRHFRDVCPFRLAFASFRDAGFTFRTAISD